MVSLLFLCLALFCAANATPVDKPKFATYENQFYLTSLVGDWYAVYYWPPNPTQHAECEKATFVETKITNEGDIDCGTKLPKDETLVHLSNSTQYYYGSGEVKFLVECKSNDPKVHKVVFKDVAKDYVLGIYILNDYRTVYALLAKKLTSAADVRAVVDTIDMVQGKYGAPDCKLP